MNYEELNKLNELREKGVITEEEFQREKERILNADAQTQYNTYGNVQNQQAQYNTYGNTQNQNSEIKYGEVQYTNNGGVELKSKLVAGLLAIFIGAFGVHNFYLGYTNKAVAQLLITLLSCGFLSFASGIWALIEGVMILTGEIKTDANGNPLKD